MTIEQKVQRLELLKQQSQAGCRSSCKTDNHDNSDDDQYEDTI